VKAFSSILDEMRPQVRYARRQRPSGTKPAPAIYQVFEHARMFEAAGLIERCLAKQRRIRVAEAQFWKRKT
jgi:hypothetical protein